MAKDTQNKTSLIISTYNWASALELCLKSIAIQTSLPDEVVIADDGSRDDTKQMIETLAKDFPVPIHHVWQEDDGFRAGQIRNKAIAKAQYPYIIQVDGDLILEKHFIDDHLFLAKEGYFVSGSRVLLSAETTQALITHHSIDISRYSQGKNKNLLNQLRNRTLCLLLADIYKQRGSKKHETKGCNIAFWRDDIVKVNGYDEAFVGWGREDSELTTRLINLGIKKRSLKMAGIGFHLEHQHRSRALDEKNMAMWQASIDNKSTWAKEGIGKYLP